MLVILNVGDIQSGPVQSFQRKINNTFNAQQLMDSYYKTTAETEKEHILRVEANCRNLEELSLPLVNQTNPDQLMDQIRLATTIGSSLLDPFDVEMEASPADILECSSRDVEEPDCQLEALIQSYQVKWKPLNVIIRLILSSIKISH